MKTHSEILNYTGVLIIFLFTLQSFISPGFAQQVKVGTYDSRVVVLAYSRSGYFREHIMKLHKESEEMMLSSDTAKMYEGFYKISTESYLGHQRVFSNGSSAAILNLVKDELPQVAKEAGIGVIVSKWELTYLDPSIEVVDLTMQIAKLFNPQQVDFEKYAGEISIMQPVPLEEIPMDEVIEMWKMFEKKYLGKK